MYLLGTSLKLSRLCFLFYNFRETRTLEKAEFLYLFVSEFLYDSVMYTICIENYEGKDVDQDYINYVKKYEKAYTRLSKQGDVVIKDAFEQLRKGQIADFYDTMIAILEVNFSLSMELRQSIDERTIHFKSLPKIDIEFIRIIREIEEELLSRKK